MKDVRMARGLDSPFYFIGNHPCLDFVNTEMMWQGTRVELLRDFRGLILWMETTGLLSAVRPKLFRQWHGTAIGEEAYRMAITLRRGLRHLLDRIVDQRSVPPSYLTMINRRLAEYRGYGQLTKKGPSIETIPRIQVSESGHLVAILAESAADLLSRQNLALIRRCRNPRCILYFIDTTRNHARHWCSMQLCGNRIKVAAHYRRQRRESEPPAKR
jgi:predicted RNA-binding Zn ribbon-like protein